MMKNIFKNLRVLPNVLFTFILAFYSVFFLVWHTTEIHLYDLRYNFLVYSMILPACIYILPRLWWSVMVLPRNKDSEFRPWAKSVASIRVLFNILFTFILAFYSVFFLVWHTTETPLYDLKYNVLVYFIMIFAACIYSLPRLWWSVMVLPHNKDSEFYPWAKNIATKTLSYFRR